MINAEVKTYHCKQYQHKCDIYLVDTAVAVVAAVVDVEAATIPVKNHNMIITTAWNLITG